MSLLEAGICRVPSVVSSIPSLRGFVGNDEYGLVVEDDRQALHAFHDLLTNPAKRVRLGAAVGERVATRFSLRASVKSLEQLYEELLGQGSPSQKKHDWCGS